VKSTRLRKDFVGLMGKLDDARKASIPPPESYFRKAKTKIDKGHYDFNADFPAASLLAPTTFLQPLWSAERVVPAPD
jgi:hypothetical protein